MSNQIDIAVLEAYLAGEIKAHDVLDTKGQSVGKEQLERALQEYQDVRIHLEGAALKERLAKSPLPEVPAIRLQRRTWWAAAAVLIIVISGLLWQGVNTPPAFEDYFEHFDQLVTFRGSDNEGEGLAEAMEKYARKKYEEAYQEFSKITSVKLNGEYLFYWGVSALGSSHFHEAVEAFESIGTETDNKYYQQTRWYLALAYWQTGEFELAVSLLKSIKEGEYKYPEAVKLIEELSQ
jgi:tetratricopeptide (TPR) repeat protein